VNMRGIKIRIHGAAKRTSSSGKPIDILETVLLPRDAVLARYIS